MASSSRCVFEKAPNLVYEEGSLGIRFVIPAFSCFAHFRCFLSRNIISRQGASNSPDDIPQIIDTDIPAANGIIHVVDGVILPPKLPELPGPEAPPPEEPDSEVPPPDENCMTIAEVACSNEDFSTLCAALTASDLADTLNDRNAEFTVFAPTNAAIEELGQDTIDALLADIPTLTNILLYHAVDATIMSKDLVPSGLIHMLNGKDTRSIFNWGGAEGIFIKGINNSRDDLPQVVSADIQACKSVVHAIDGVLLP